MAELTLEVGSIFALEKPAFDQLLAALRELGYQTVGPRAMQDVISYAPMQGLQDLPRGYTSVQDAGRYKLVYSGHPRYFDVTPGAESWKRFFFPARAEMFTIQRDETGWKVEPPAEDLPVWALVGVRPCELAAIQVQDRVFLRDEWSDPIYRTRRERAFIVTVNCLHPCGTCFCDSMGSGPKADSGFDISLTELEDWFLFEIGSEAGKIIAAQLPLQPASAFLIQNASRGFAEARRHMGRVMPNPDALPEILLGRLEHPRWDDVAQRCLSCTNCTQVCPTCFCWDANDHPDLSGNTSRRVRVWDSCFNPDYSYIAGGNTRPNTRSRYRQWLTHKVASWHHQFGVSGCVGCGRCITWCPAYIDITEEVAALLEEAAE